MGSPSPSLPIPLVTVKLSGLGMGPSLLALRMTVTPEYPFFAVEHVQWYVVYSCGNCSRSFCSISSMSSSFNLCSFKQKTSGFSRSIKWSNLAALSEFSTDRKLATLRDMIFIGHVSDSSETSCLGVKDRGRGDFLSWAERFVPRCCWWLFSWAGLEVEVGALAAVFAGVSLSSASPAEAFPLAFAFPLALALALPLASALAFAGEASAASFTVFFLGAIRNVESASCCSRALAIPVKLGARMKVEFKRKTEDCSQQLNAIYANLENKAVVVLFNCILCTQKWSSTHRFEPKP
mmetsp:Transcript_89791/g.187655  ORF Transcript_89791/g.187655 Transcript_89791/m.187655 type:complete len:293 (-) Transcript_89791:2-880(-)